MPTAKVLLRTYQQKKDGTYPVVIREYDGRKTRFHYTDFAVKENQFRDEKGKWITRHPKAALMNTKLNQMLLEFTPEIFARKQMITDYLTARSVQYGDMQQPDTAAKLSVLKAEIIEMENRQNVPFSDITADWIRRYRAHLVKVHGNGNNTIVGKLKLLGRMYKDAVKDNCAKPPNPFEDLKHKQEPVNKEKLILDEIHLIEKVELDGFYDTVRDAFLFAFYAHGMRFQNIFTLEWKMITDGVLDYTMNKGKKSREINLPPVVLTILKKYPQSNKYVFPFCKREWKDKKDFNSIKGSANAQVNTALKVVAAKAKVNKLVSMHIARHSFAHLLKSKKVDLHVIQAALGHSKMETTERYLKDLDDDVINDEVGKAFL